MRVEIKHIRKEQKDKSEKLYKFVGNFENEEIWEDKKKNRRTLVLIWFNGTYFSLLLNGR